MIEPISLQIARSMIIPHTGGAVAFESSEIDKGQYNDVRSTYSTSLGLMVRSEVLRTLRGFDERTRIATEDLDFGWRIWFAGYKVVFVPTARLWHERQACANSRGGKTGTDCSRPLHA